MFHFKDVSPLLTHLWLVDIGWCPLLAIVNNVAMRTYAQVPVWSHVFNYLEYMPRCGIAVSQGNSVFNLLRNCQASFHSGFTIYIFISNAQGSNFSRYCQDLLLSVSFIIYILVDMKQDLPVVLICSSLLTNDVDHLLMYLLAIFISSLEKSLFGPFSNE